MKNAVVQNDVEDFSALTNLEEQAPLFSTSDVLSPLLPARSYHPTPWSFVNSLLDIVDVKTAGKAGIVQRVISYLFFGGTAALVNLVVFAVIYYKVSLPSVIPLPVHNIIAYVCAAELSILANFIPNDRFTFRDLPGASRPWAIRCMRFHMTCMVGTLLTFLLEFGMSNFAHMPALLAEAVATLLVLVYNFTFHHIFTYRHTNVSHA